MSHLGRFRKGCEKEHLPRALASFVCYRANPCRECWIGPGSALMQPRPQP